VDITDVPPGDYLLRITINPDRTIAESNYDNNVAEIPVSVAAPGSEDPTAPCSGPLNGPGRECGWALADKLQAVSCTPGDPILVGCGGCSGEGVCGGDPMLRVCAGKEACLAFEALASNDDSCSFCPETTFECPPGGVYTVMTGAFTAGAFATCQPVATVVGVSAPLGDASPPPAADAGTSG
jgi:hypothetical protein